VDRTRAQHLLLLAAAMSAGAGVLGTTSPAGAATGGDRAALEAADEGRRHAQKAGELAAAGKCRQAIAEYDQALAVLRDPALLFNRAECHRRLGEAQKALEDYNQFLADLPRAPNRREVEAHIAELSKLAPAAAPTPRFQPPPPTRAATGSPEPERAEAGAAAPATPPPPAWAPTATGASTEAGRAASAEAAPPADRGSREGPPWMWLALGTVVAVGAGLAVYMIFRDETNVPQSALGNYRF
jgi:tetratricopeptide (TPR) repeat protein